MSLRPFIPKCPDCGALIRVDPNDCPECNRKATLDELRHLVGLMAGVNRNVSIKVVNGQKKLRRIRR